MAEDVFKVVPKLTVPFGTQPGGVGAEGLQKRGNNKALNVSRIYISFC